MVRTNYSDLEVEIDRRSGRTELLMTQVDQSYQTPFCSIASKKMRTLVNVFIFQQFEIFANEPCQVVQNICKHHSDRDSHAEFIDPAAMP